MSGRKSFSAKFHVDPAFRKDAVGIICLVKGGASMVMVILNIVVVLAIIYVVPFLVYGLATTVTSLKPPEGASPARFLISVLVSKIGTAIAFVLIFYIARSSMSGQWFLYAFVWWIMIVIGEIGQAIGPNYTWKEAIAGILSETIYLPLSAYITELLIGIT